MSIRKFAVEQTKHIHFKDADDELMFENGKPVGGTFYGPGSKQYAKAQAKQSNRFMDSIKKKGKTAQTAEQKAVEQAEFLADITVSLDNVLYEDDEGTPLEGRTLQLALYSDRELGFITDQIAKETGEWSNFSKPSATN
jgi:hypothetical protein